MCSRAGAHTAAAWVASWAQCYHVVAQGGPWRLATDVGEARPGSLAAEVLAASPTKSRPYAARNLDAALGPAPAPFSLDDDGPVGFELPDFAIEA